MTSDEGHPMQWHPLFVDLLRPLVEDHYEVRTGQTVGDLPREADVVLLHRRGSGPSPFKGMWRWLTSWNLLEYKGPTVSARQSALHDLIELGLGICRRLNETAKKEQRTEQDCPQVSFWYLVNDLGSRFLAEGTIRLPGLESLAPGVWRAELLRHGIFLVSVQDMVVERDSLPFHVLSGVPEKDRSTVTNLLRADEHLWPRYGAWLALYDPAIWQEIQQMSNAKLAEEGKLDYGPLHDYLRKSGDIKRFVEGYGIKEAVQAVGVKEAVQAIGVKEAVQAIGVKEAVQAIGVKEAVQAVGVDEVWKSLSPQQREQLLRLVKAESTPPPAEPEPPV